MVSHSQIYVNCLTRVALLNVDTEEDVNWDAICWKMWPANKLWKRWAGLKADAKVDKSMSHQGEYKFYCTCTTVLTVSSDTMQQLRGRWGNVTS